MYFYSYTCMVHTRVVSMAVSVAIAKQAMKTMFHISDAMNAEGKFVCGA